MPIKEIVKIIAVMLAFYFGVPYLVRLFSTPTLDISYDTAVSGRITGNRMNRQYYVHHLDGDSKTYYDFNRFGPARPLPTGLSQEEINSQSLGHYLRTGDEVAKEAHSGKLLVHRIGDNSTTTWVCAAPEAGH